MENLENLQQRIHKIEERNIRVEADKAWETSKTRMCIIGIITYGCASILLLITKLPHPFLSATVPTLGWILSVQSLPWMKKWWIRKALSQK